jgi:hypothetical protein
LATGLPGWLAGWHAPQGGVGDDSGSGRRLAAAGLVANPGAAVSLPPGPLIPNLLSGKAINSDFVPPVQARVVTKAWARPPFSFCAFSTSRPTFTVVVVVVAWLVFSLPKPSTSPGTWRPTGLLLPHLVTPTSKPVTPRRASISPCSRVGHALELRVCAQNIYKQADSIAPRTIVNVSFSGILSGSVHDRPTSGSSLFRLRRLRRLCRGQHTDPSFHYKIFNVWVLANPARAALLDIHLRLHTHQVFIRCGRH